MDKVKPPDAERSQSFAVETEAMRALGELLTPLTPEARERLIMWAMDYFKIQFRRF